MKNTKTTDLLKGVNGSPAHRSLEIKSFAYGSDYTNKISRDKLSKGGSSGTAKAPLTKKQTQENYKKALGREVSAVQKKKGKSNRSRKMPTKK